MTRIEAMTFKELPIGARFMFDPGVWTFSEVCTKISARRYSYGGAGRRSQVGRISVGVRPVTGEQSEDEKQQ